MLRIKHLFVSVLILSFFAAGGAATAQEGSNLDTTVNPEDLGVGRARVLPDSPFYGLKNMFRNMRFTFTFDPVAKAEYKLQVSNEKMIEAKQLIEENKSEQARQTAFRTIDEANKDLEGIASQGAQLKQLKTKQAPAVNKFLDKVADQSMKQQVLLQKLGEQVPEESFAKIEQVRQRHLERFGQVMTRVSDKPQEMQERFSKVVEERQGSNFKEMKAIEILRDLEDKVDAPEAKEALRMAQERLSQNFEKRFLAVPEDVRGQKFSDYVESLPGNPLRQFETLDQMKQSFQSADAASVLEIGKDRAANKFENQFNQFSQDEARAGFMQPWVNGDPQDLRTMTEIQMRIEPSRQFQPFQQEAMENFKQKFNENPETFRNDPYLQKMRENPDVVDVQFSRELSQEIKEPFAQEMKEQTAQKFIQNAQGSGAPARFAPPIPRGMEVLRELKEELPQQAQQGINRAINAQTEAMQRHIQKIDDPAMFQRFERQIEQNPNIKQEIRARGGQEFFNKMEQRGQEMEKIRQQQNFMPQAAPVQSAIPVMREGGAQQPPERPVIPLPGSPGYSGPTPEQGVAPKPEAIQPLPAESKQPMEQRPMEQNIQPMQQMRVEPPSGSLWGNFLGSVANTLLR